MREALESTSGNSLQQNSEKVQAPIPSDPQKQRFRIGGVTKITKSGCPPKVSNMPPKSLPKSPQIDKHATPAAYQKSTEKHLQTNTKNYPKKHPKGSPKSSQNRQQTLFGPVGCPPAHFCLRRVARKGSTPPPHPTPTPPPQKLKENDEQRQSFCFQQ